MDQLNVSRPAGRLRSYRELIAWQKAMELCKQVYACSESWSRHEMFGLTQQVHRAAVSVMANIAEGWGRGSRPDYIRFLRMARGSVCELEAELLLADQLGYMPQATTGSVVEFCGECSRVLQGLIASLERLARQEGGGVG